MLYTNSKKSIEYNQDKNVEHDKYFCGMDNHRSEFILSLQADKNQINDDNHKTTDVIGKQYK